jgi:hypothetical protein
MRTSGKHLAGALLHLLPGTRSNNVIPRPRLFVPGCSTSKSECIASLSDASHRRCDFCRNPRPPVFSASDYDRYGQRVLRSGARITGSVAGVYWSGQYPQPAHGSLRPGARHARRDRLRLPASPRSRCWRPVLTFSLPNGRNLKSRGRSHELIANAPHRPDVAWTACVFDLATQPANKDLEVFGGNVIVFPPDSGQ